MKITKNAVVSIFRRLELLAYSVIFFILFSLFNRINPVLTIMTGFMDMGDTDLLTNIMTFLQFLLGKDMILYTVLVFVGAAVFIAPFLGLILSGFLYTANNAVSGGIRKKAEFIYGVRNHYVKITIIMVKVILSSLLFLLFLFTATVPLMAIFRTAVFSSPSAVIISLFIGVLTTCVLFLGSMFYRIYIGFWIAGAINNAKKPFANGRKLADKYFWKVVFAFTFFDVVFVVFHTAMMYFEDSIYIFAVKSLFNTLFYTLFSLYVLSAYAYYKRA